MIYCGDPLYDEVKRHMCGGIEILPCKDFLFEVQAAIESTSPQSGILFPLLFVTYKFA